MSSVFLNFNIKSPYYNNKNDLIKKSLFQQIKCEFMINKEKSIAIEPYFLQKYLKFLLF